MHDLANLSSLTPIPLLSTMLDPAQKPAEPLPSEPPSEAVTVTVGGLDIAALLQGYALYRVVPTKQLICSVQVDSSWPSQRKHGFDF